MIFSRTLLRGGAEKQSILLANAIKEKYNVFFVVLHGNETNDSYLNQIKQNQIKLILLTGSFFQKLISLIYFLKSVKVDIIFSYLFITNVVAVLVGKINRIPIIIGGIRNSKIPYYKLCVHRLLHNHFFYKTIFNNYSGYKYLTNRGFKSSKSIVIQNGILINSPKRKRERNSILQILTVARFTHQKDPITALKTVQHLINLLSNEVTPLFQYIWVGYGKMQKNLEYKINEMELNEKVTLIINPIEVEKYYINSDIYFSTSLFEGLSNSIMEAMNYSLPIVATNVGDNARLVKDGVNGFLVNCGDYNAAAEKLKDLLIDEKKREIFGDYSYKILKSHFSFHSFQKKYIKLIESLHI